MRKVIDGVAKNLFTLFMLVISLVIGSIGLYCGQKYDIGTFWKYNILTGYKGSNIQHHIKVERNNLK